MAQLKLNLKDSTGIVEKTANVKSNNKYILFLIRRKLAKDDKLFISSFLKDGYRGILATDNEANLTEKIDNCFILYLDLNKPQKVEKFVSIVKPAKIIEKWKKK